MCIQRSLSHVSLSITVGVAKMPIGGDFVAHQLLGLFDIGKASIALARPDEAFADTNLDYYFFPMDGTAYRLRRIGWNDCGAPVYEGLDAMEKVSLEISRDAPRPGGYGVRPPYGHRDATGYFPPP